MAIFDTTGGRSTYTEAVVRANPTTYSTRDWSQPGQATPDASGLSERYDGNHPPFGLGTGVLVDTVGRYLMGPEQDAIVSFTVLNSASVSIYAGINVPESGEWAVENGLEIPANSSYEFGEEGTQIIRNVWAMTNTSAGWVQGYATRQLTTL